MIFASVVYSGLYCETGKMIEIPHDFLRFLGADYAHSPDRANDLNTALSRPPTMTYVRVNIRSIDIQSALDLLQTQIDEVTTRLLIVLSTRNMYT